MQSRLLFYIPVLALLVAASCGKQPSKIDAVYMGASPVYRLEKGCREVTPNATAVKRYEQMFNYYAQYNVPLHRIVMADSVVVYLGLVVDPMPAKLTNLIESDSVWTLIATKPVPNGVFAMLKHKSGGFNVRYLASSSKTKQVHAINLFTDDSTSAIPYFDEKNIFKGNLLF